MFICIFRSAGFIAVHATLASGDVDLCLVPEINIELEGEQGCLPHIMQRLVPLSLAFNASIVISILLLPVVWELECLSKATQ